MIKLLLFLKRIHYVLLFIVLETAAIIVFTRSNPYHNARMINAANIVTGNINQQLYSVNDYFNLRNKNHQLVEENAGLRAELSRYKEMVNIIPELHIDSNFQIAPLQYIAAEVIDNNFTKRHNYLMINRGAKHGIRPEMGVIADNGIVGSILDCSENFSVGISILNEDFTTSGKIKGKDYTGSIKWDGTDHRYVDLIEISPHAQLSIGDTVVTTKHSDIFPPELPIGTVESYELDNTTFYKTRVKLFADMSRLKYVYVTGSENQQEKKELESKIKDL